MNTVKIEHKLLTNAWIDDALTVMAVVRAFVRRRPLHDGCRIVLFELDGDAALHVNVTHQRSTATPAGWSGPGHTAEHRDLQLDLAERGQLLAGGHRVGLGGNAAPDDPHLVDLR